jgi:hypothetical protein
MPRLRSITTLMLVLACTAPAVAANLAQGMHGMQWGSAITQNPRLVKIREAGALTYYVDGATRYSLSREPVPSVIYGADQGRFFAVYIRLTNPDQFYYTERHFRSQYGPPKRSVAEGGRQVVYRWAKDDIKVKLKMNESAGEIKLGIYYAPIANTLNPDQAEEGPGEGGVPQGPTATEHRVEQPLF